MKERQQTQERHVWFIHRGADGRMLMTSGQIEKRNAAKLLRGIRRSNRHTWTFGVPISTNVSEIPNISDVLFLLVEGKS